MLVFAVPRGQCIYYQASESRAPLHKGGRTQKLALDSTEHRVGAQKM